MSIPAAPPTTPSDAEPASASESTSNPASVTDPPPALVAPFRAGAPTVRLADFVAESRGVGSLPPVGPPEIAIAGRSNVGKSTLLNRLAGRRGLARTSKTPGRTRGIVFYDLQVADEGQLRSMRLADLPGYGYAQVSKTERQSWRILIETYARARPTLALFMVLVDARRGIEEEERQLLEWLASIQVPEVLVFTKVDKVSAGERGLLRQRARDALGVPASTSAAAPKPRRTLLVSGETGEGLDALWGEMGRALPREG